MDTAEARQKIEEQFPFLANCGYRITSAQDSGYNCIGYAAGDNEHWWQPGPGYYWPDGVVEDESIEALVSVFAALGYDICDNRDIESGYEKIALYGDQDCYTHAAKQEMDGKWKSKLGNWEDIEHNSLDGLRGKDYGKVICIMRRAHQ